MGSKRTAIAITGRKLTAQQSQFLALYLEGYTATKAAEAAGYGTPAVRGHELTNLLREEIDAGVKARLAQYSPRALANMAKLAEKAESESVRFQANKDLLDRAGIKVPDAIESEGPIDPKSQAAQLVRLVGEGLAKEFLRSAGLPGVLLPGQQPAQPIDVTPQKPTDPADQ